MNISKTTWPADTDKIVTVIAAYNSQVKALYKKRGTATAFQPLVGTFQYMGDDIWELTAKLPVGEYLIKILIDGTDIIYMLEVVDKDIYNQSLVLELIKDDIENLTARVMSKLSFKVSG